MKRLLYPILLLLFAIATQAQNIPSYVPTNGLVGWWPFNGNANDESGNGNHGTVNGATLISDRFGNTNSAYSFNGISDFITCTPNLPKNSMSRSVVSWFKSNAGSNFSNIQCINAWGSGGGGTVIFPQYIIANSGKAWFETGSSSNSIYSNIAINDFQWHQIVTTYNGPGTCIKMFIDGFFQDSTNNLTINTYQSVLKIGNAPWANLPFSGLIDDVSIYDRALTQEEISTLYRIYNIHSSSASSGYITPTGNTNLKQGSTQSYTITPNAGFLVDSVIVDGNKVDSIQGYTFSNVSAHHSIRVSFKVDSNNVSINFPTGISYQAIARDSAGKVLANSPIKLRFSIKENSMNGNTVYTETANLTTNKLGLFTCIIGNNNAILGNYKNIDWMGASKFLQVELEQAGNYVLLGSQQLLSVPYANAAKEATKIKNAALPVYNSNSDALQGGLKPGEMYRTNAGILMIVY